MNTRSLLSIATVIACVALASDALPHAGIGIYEDADGTDCHLAGNPGGFKDFFIVAHPFNGGDISGVQFAAPFPACPGTYYLGETPVPEYLSIGSSQTGISIFLGSCMTDPNIVLLTIRVGFAPGAAMCCPWPVVPDPSVSVGYVVATSCSFVEFPGTGYTAYLNDDGTCEHAGPCGGLPLAVEQTTWGGIKSLFR